jgi:hypothetical protein
VQGEKKKKHLLSIHEALGLSHSREKGERERKRTDKERKKRKSGREERKRQKVKE